MHRFIGRENVKRDWLVSKTEGKKRSVLTQLLVEEEDKLGADFEPLADLDGHITRGRELIRQQTVLVVSMERDGHNGIGQAKSLLAALIASQDLHQKYRQRVLIRIEENKL